ncbi:hypothetical protein D3C71_2166760 [compost metagenome]
MNGFDNSISAPTNSQLLGLHIDIAFVVRMNTANRFVVRKNRHTSRSMRSRSFPHGLRMTRARGSPISHAT